MAIPGVKFGALIIKTDSPPSINVYNEALSKKEGKSPTGIHIDDTLVDNKLDLAR